MQQDNLNSQDYELLLQQNSAEEQPAREEIAKLAYSLWEARGGGDGSAEQDWLQAERQLRKPMEALQELLERAAEAS